MAQLKPFRGIRPRPELAGRVAAPPYDVLSSAEARLQAAGNPLSFLHVNKAEIDLDPGMDPHDERVYDTAAANFRRLLDDGVLQRDAQPCYYLYRLNQGGHEQTGLVALASVAEYENGSIRRHELTRPDKELDRVKHIDRVNAQVGPVYLAYRAQTALDALLASHCAGEAAADFQAEDGVRHRLWLLSDPEAQQQVTEAFAALPRLYVADGHHRSAAALRVRDLRQQARPAAEAPWHWFLAVIFPHSQLRILDYNRLLRTWGDSSAEAFLAQLGQRFELEAWPGQTACRPARPGEFALYLAGGWQRLRLPAALLEQQDPVARLDVNLLQEEVLAPLLGIADARSDPRLDFMGGSRGLVALQAAVDSGDYVLAIACHPTAMEQLLEVADADRIMPPKSTWFEPKLRSGLVVHPLD